MQALATVSALPVFAEAQSERAPSASEAPPEPSTAPPTADLVPGLHDDVAAGVPGFFTEDRRAALERLGDLLMPSGERPGASEAGAAAFLDFHVSRSPEARRSVYASGLDALNRSARERYGRAFARVADEEAHALLAPLREPWTPGTPGDPLAAFLRVAKEDLGSATVNSKVYLEAQAEGEAGRRRGGVGLYWYTIE